MKPTKFLKKKKLLGEINYQIVFNEASIESIQYYINIKDCCAQKQREALTADIKRRRRYL
jgi:hypothetical protein